MAFKCLRQTDTSRFIDSIVKGREPGLPPPPEPAAPVPEPAVEQSAPAMK